MGKDGSVAPRERVNIKFKPATGDAQEEKELPNKALILGDFTMQPDARPLEERQPVSVDKDNFNDVMREMDLKADLGVKDVLSGEEDAEMAVSLKFSSLKDFSPEAVAEQVPQLKAMLELRAALVALKGPLGNMQGFRKKIQAIIADDTARAALLEELKKQDAAEGGDSGGGDDAS